MRLEQVIIGVALFGLVMFVGLALVNESITNYDLDTDEDSIFGRVDDSSLYNASEGYNTFREDIDPQGVDDDIDESSTYRAGIPSAKDIFDHIVTIGDTLSKIAFETKLLNPSIVTFLIIAFGTMAAAFVLYMFWRFKPQ